MDVIKIIKLPANIMNLYVYILRILLTLYSTLFLLIKASEVGSVTISYLMHCKAVPQSRTLDLRIGPRAQNTSQADVRERMRWKV